MYPAGEMGDEQQYHGEHGAHRGADERGVDQVALHQGLDLVEVAVTVRRGVVRGEEVALGRDDACCLQVLLQSFEVIHVRTDEEASRHLHGNLPPSAVPLRVGIAPLTHRKR